MAPRILYNSIYVRSELHLFAKNKFKHSKGTLIIRFPDNVFFVPLDIEQVITKVSIYSESAWNSL